MLSLGQNAGLLCGEDLIVDCNSGAHSVNVRIRRAAASIETPCVLTALDGLEMLFLQHCDRLDDRMRARLENDYLQTLELTLHELGQEEEYVGGDIETKAALCLRVINVLSQMISDSNPAQKECRRQSLEAEVAALERLAATRGDFVASIKPKD